MGFDKPTAFIRANEALPTQYKYEKTYHSLKNQATGDVPIQPVIKWDEDKGSRAGNALFSTRKIESVKEHFPEAYSHCLMMYEKLNFHRNHFNKDLPDPIIMVARSLILGPSFTDEWASSFKNSKFEWMGMDFLTPPDKSKHPMKINNFNDAYQPFHFIFWDEEINDYTYMFSKIDEPEDEYLARVKDISSQMSKLFLTDEEILSEPPEEHIWRPTNTNAFDMEGTKPEWELEFDNPELDYMEEILVSKRGIAPKRPSEIRDIGVMHPTCIRQHRRFMYYLQNACKRIPGCPHGRDLNHLKKTVSLIGKKNTYFYMRDYTKSGMTVPHPVVRAVFEGFFERRPDLAKIAPKFYETQQFWIKEGEGLECLKPLTGSPLGLFVEGYTILQYAIHEINLSGISAPRDSFYFSATNDDMVVGSDSKTDIYEYQNVDIITNNALSMRYKDTKSGITKDRFVFCEEYWIDDHIANKESLYCGSLLSAKFCVNIVHAKDYVYSILLSCEVTPAIEAAFKEVVTFWGFEFSEQEWGWPYLFGGWLPQIKSGIDYSYDWFTGDLASCCAYWAARIRIRKKGKLGDQPHLAIGRRLGVELLREPTNESDWIDLVPLLGTKKTLQDHFRKQSVHPIRIVKLYQALITARKRKFDRFMSGKEDLPEVLSGWLDRHPNSVIRAGIPGLVTAPAMDRIIKPRNGIKREGIHPWLCALHQKGTLIYQKASDVPKTLLEVYEIGVVNPCTYPYLPVPEQGVGQKVLSKMYPGLIPFYEETGRAIVTYGDDDKIYEPTRLWRFMKPASLITLSRFWKQLLKLKQPRDIQEHHLAYFGEIYVKFVKLGREKEEGSSFSNHWTSIPKSRKPRL